MTFTFKQKEKLLGRIKAIANKNDYIKIFQIIYNKNTDITENNNGIFIMFHDLPDDVYKKIDHYLNTKKN